MFATAFPDLGWLKTQIDNRFTNRRTWTGGSLEHEGWPSVVLNVTAANVYRDNILGPYSLFGNISGSSIVVIDGKRKEIPEGYFLITNAGQHYTLEINRAETFNVHFGEHLANKSSLVEGGMQSMDESFTGEFLNRLIPFDGLAVEAIKRLKHNEGQLAEEEILSEWFERLLNTEKEFKQVPIPALKKSTRDELRQRISVATDFVIANSHRSLSLDVISREAGVSKFHFLRMFKMMHGLGPHQFVTKTRIEKAKALLHSGHHSMTEVAHLTGFDSAISFSRAFSRAEGLAPSRFAIG